LENERNKIVTDLKFIMRLNINEQGRDLSLSHYSWNERGRFGGNICNIVNSKI